MRQQTNQPPTVLVDLSQGDNQINYFFLRHGCPFCNIRNMHGAGVAGEDPRKNEGSRVSHCCDGEKAEYVLKWTGETLPIGEVKRVRCAEAETLERKREARRRFEAEWRTRNGTPTSMLRE